MTKKLFASTAYLTLIIMLAGCEDSMRDQARIKPYAESAFFADNRSARIPPPGTVARGQLHDDLEFSIGATIKDNVVTFVPHNPVALTAQLLERGQERYTIFCSVCHGADGYGKGVVVERGFSPPPSYHIDRLCSAPDGYLFDVIGRGKGAMFPYGSRIPPADRWAIVAYVRALQVSQNYKLNDIPDDERRKLEALHE